MSSNFGIIIGKNKNNLVLELTGDFDGTSAYELINLLKSCPDDVPRIFIHTNGLKNVFPFGRDLLRKFLQAIEGYSSRIEFTGNHALTLSLEKESACSSGSRCHPARSVVSRIQPPELFAIET